MRYVWWCPAYGLEHTMLTACGWIIENTVNAGNEVWVKMVLTQKEKSRDGK